MSEEHAPTPKTNVAVCSTEGCERNATHSFTWDWGDSGFCCATCMVSLSHRMQSLARNCTFVALTPGAAPELSHDDRLQLNARVLAAEQEAALTKTRNLKLFDSNQDLAREVNALRAEVDQHKQQLADTRAELEQCITEKQRALQQLAETNHELARLQGIADAVAVAP